MPRAIKGVLITCDPSIKAIIVKIDSEAGHVFIIEELDDEHVVIKENMVTLLKMKLDDILKETRNVKDTEFSDEEKDERDERERRQRLRGF